MTTIMLKLNGLHCTSCALNIDSELEDLPGVISSKTSYVKQESIITYDPLVIKPTQFNSVIESLGYKIVA